MWVRRWALVAWLGVAGCSHLCGQVDPAAALTKSDFKAASDSVTKGWLENIPWPDQDDASQRWRTIAVKVVITRHGRVIRRIDGGVGIWDWNFWKGGQQVAIERGPVHGETTCSLVEVRSGRTVKDWPGDCRSIGDDSHVPNWVKAATGALKAKTSP